MYRSELKRTLDVQLCSRQILFCCSLRSFAINDESFVVDSPGEVSIQPALGFCLIDQEGFRKGLFEDRTVLY